MGFDNYVAPLQLFLERYRAAHRLSSIFPNGAAPRSFSSDGSSTAVNNASPEASGNQEYPQRSSVALSSTTCTTTAGTHTYHTATTAHDGGDAHSGTGNTSSTGAPIVLAGGVGGMPVTALHQQPMQIYIDPASKQHYMAIETEQGMQLYPIQIQTDGPVAYTVTSEVATAMTSSSSGDNQAGVFHTFVVDYGSLLLLYVVLDFLFLLCVEAVKLEHT
ncbi:unnamed protein product [Strongylus vulgaris]|uniref:Transcription factor CBF/NF-Y/archaeal histone domain-containing protein n=1 Tax=Strongylus vulgaris TaxID=40348 RepID=A0A3P7I877_STRVU|nr:unnamed protein product [Strongylus vulgaris]